MEEKAPLLVNVEEAEDEDDTDAVRYRGPSPRQKVKSLYQSDRVLGRHSPYTGLEDEVVNISASSSMHNFNLAEEDCIVSIFVVAFDTKAGESSFSFETVNSLKELNCEISQFIRKAAST